MELARHRTFDAGVGVGHRHEAQLIDQRLALAGIAAGRLGTCAVARVLREHRELIGTAFLELVRACADELLELRRQHLLGHDRGHSGRRGEQGQQRCVRGLEFDLDGVRPLGGERFHLLGHRLAARRHFHPALQRSHDIGRIHVLAVVELHALAQRDRIDQTVLRHHGQTLGQHRRNRPFAIEGVQRLEHVLHDRADQIRGGQHRIETLRLPDHRQIERATGGRSRCDSRSADRHHSRRGKAHSASASHGKRLRESRCVDCRT